jgi:hypothetical protein
MREEKNARNSSEHQLVDAKHDAGDARRADGGLFEDAAEGEVLFERTNVSDFEISFGADI